MGSVKVWKLGESGAPKYPADYSIVRKAVLQVTDIKSNHNKYYALELHSSGAGASAFRLFTHYGRTDDLEGNPEAGQKECRYFSTMDAALAEYMSIYRQKTAAAKGYKEVSLASSKIGSQRARGQSAGDLDQKTIERMAQPTAAPAAPSPTASTLSPSLSRLVGYLYAEATGALTQTVAATITAKGIETPLGVLTIGQIEKGESILHQLYDHFQQKRKSRDRMISLSGEFYTTIPHRIGRTRGAVEAAVIDSMEDFEHKQETLQLMKDMLLVNGHSGGVLYNKDIDAKYEALKCDLRPLDGSSDEYRKLVDYLVKSQIKARSFKVKNVFGVRRDAEWSGFNHDIDNQRLLFHGSRIKNWMGILSRGLLMPKIAVSMGVTRTDAGWLGNGIYFGDAACTSAFYTSAGREGTRFMAVARVGLGQMKDFTKITYGLSAPPAGFQSCHGVRARPGVVSQFSDDEYVVYESRQQRIEYLVEFTALACFLLTSVQSNTSCASPRWCECLPSAVRPPSDRAARHPGLPSLKILSAAGASPRRT
jgi:poly [ADP-ribose] polymerase 2/3/4